MSNLDNAGTVLPTFPLSEYEKFVVGSILLDENTSNIIDEVHEILSPCSWHNKHAKILFDIIVKARAAGIPIELTKLSMTVNGEASAFDKEGGFLKFCSDCIAMFPDGTGLIKTATYAHILKRRWHEEKLREIAHHAQVSPDDKNVQQKLRAVLDIIDGAENHKNGADPLKNFIAHPPDENYLIEGVLPEKGIVQIFGSPGVGKSFLAIDMGMSVAAGRPWCGFKTEQVPVLYIAAEGLSGLKARMKAWCERHGIIPELFYVQQIPVGLTVPGAAKALAKSKPCRPHLPRLIILDTLAANFGPGNENETQDMTQAMNALKELAGDGLAMCIHHSGHLDKTRGRGSSVASATFEVDLMVTRDDPHGPIKLEHTKTRDINKMNPLYFTLEPQVLPWANKHGDPLNSAVIVPADGYVEQSNRKDRVVGQIRAALAGGPLTIRQLRQAVNAKYEFINQVKFQMLEQGSLRLIQGPRNSQSLALVDTPPKEAQ